MTTMKLLEKKLQKADQKQAVLYLFCNFVSLVIITAYSAMMLSPTVLLVLPQGGDSRKQMTAVFVLALFGCTVFTVYASCLFFRKKSRQLGTLMALGASRKRLAPGLFREVLLLSGTSSFLGILAGIPFVWLLWNGFRLFLVNSQEMTLKLDFRFLYLSAAFFVLVVACSCINAFRYLKRTNIMDVVREEHRNEPVKQLGRWCGPLGFLLVLAGAVMGYSAPDVYMKLFHAYPNALLNLLYAPVFAGLYLIMLHTVTHGWHIPRKNPYKNLISRSMMKFQGKQTVNNLLVSTVLIAGGSFAMFYLPTLGVSSVLETASRPFDYFYHYRQDQHIPGERELSAMAREHGTAIRDFREVPYLSLGMDGTTQIEDGGNSFHIEYIELLEEGKFFSETDYETLTGEKLSVKKGSYYAISNEAETGTFYINTEASKLTNMDTRQSLPVSFAGFAHYGLLSDRIGYYILNDEDYSQIARDLSPQWMGRCACFNADGTDSYEFAQDFFHTLVSSFGPECEYPDTYDRVYKIYLNEQGETYWGDTDQMSRLSYDHPDTTDFRTYWTYMPKSRMLDRSDFVKNFAVFLMMFLFIAIICSLAAMVIGYTRCLTIALNNRSVFEDLKRLGASPAFLRREIKSQAGPVFQFPGLMGMGIMYFLYFLILLANDGKFTTGEAIGMAACFGLLLIFAGIYFLVYRFTVKSMCRQLEIL